MFGDVITPIDLIIFFAALVGVMVVGLIAGRREESSEDYFLAGRKIPWWGVAGSIFGSNVSANHMVGMMGIGFSVGFAQSHFELGAIFGLLALCYGFLPVYRKLNIYTLSEYLGRRYDDLSRVSYAVIMVIIMAVVQMVPGLYIGARTICVMMEGDAVEIVAGGHAETVGSRDRPPAADGNAVAKTPPAEVKVNKNYYMFFVIALAVISATYTIFGGLKAVVWTDVMQSVLLLAAGIWVSILTFQYVSNPNLLRSAGQPVVAAGEGAAGEAESWFGRIQSGWDEMRKRDRVEDQRDGGKMHLYLPPQHPQLPWTGVLTGLLCMHFFYWGTNQFIVQRALAARSDAAARTGIVAAGFLKLLIPFFAIGTGVAAFYMFPNALPDPDTAFSELVKLVIPIGTGLIGLIAAGLIGAILSSIDSMMNSAATIVTVDIYKKYIRPDATDEQMIKVGRISIVVFVVVAAWMAIVVLDPNSKANFFLTIADYQNYLTPGLLVAFVLGMLWRGGTATAAFLTIIAGIGFSWAVVAHYDHHHGMNPAVYSVLTETQPLDKVKINDLPEELRDKPRAEIAAAIESQRDRLTWLNTRIGPQLNFFHRVVAVIALCALVFVVVSRLTRRSFSLMGFSGEDRQRLVWTDLGGHAPGALGRLGAKIGGSIGFYALLGFLMYAESITPTFAAIMAMVWTWAMYFTPICASVSARRAAAPDSGPIGIVLTEDRVWAGLLCSFAVFMHFYFY
ncbi:MAG: sodium/solute symporter [Planctomycetota bacterium]|nr:sodium/solute symporter [Planctomycetota bacterium]